MPLGNEIGKFLWNIAEKKNGFDFGKPWKQSSKSLGLVIPILRTSSVKRKYKMMEEVKGKIDIEDTGAVNIMKVISKDDMNVFIRSGLVLEGGGQTRCVISGMIVMPNSTQDIDVKCVYASKPTQRGAKMHISDIAPPIVMQSLHESQRDTWDSVQTYSAKMCHDGRRSSGMYMLSGIGSGREKGLGRIGRVSAAEEVGSDDLAGIMREVEKGQKDVEGAIKDIPVMENQVGCIIFDIDSIVGFEVFDSPKSWKSMHKQVIKKYNEVLRKEQEKMLFELKPEVIPEKIAEFIEEICKSDEKTSHETEVSRTIVVDGERHVGEYTTIGADVIHIIMFKRSTKKKDNPSSGGYRQPGSRIRSSLEPDVDQEVVAGLQADY